MQNKIIKKKPDKSIFYLHIPTSQSCLYKRGKKKRFKKIWIANVKVMLMNQFGKIIGHRHSRFIQSQTYHSKSMRKVYGIFGFRLYDLCSMGSALRNHSRSSIHYHHLPLVQSPLLLPSLEHALGHSASADHDIRSGIRFESSF